MVQEPIDYYNANAQEYARKTRILDMTPIYEKFLPMAPEGGHILDAGCGSGRDSAFFLKKGFEVSAFDASTELVKEANSVLPIDVQLMTFQNMDFVPQSFDAVWASASLLHLVPEELPVAISKLSQCIKTGGVLFCSFKKGKGLRVDELGRRFTDMTEEGLMALFKECGIRGVDVFTREGGAGERWINGFARV